MNRITKRREDLKSLEAHFISRQNWDLIWCQGSIILYTNICHKYHMRYVYYIDSVYMCTVHLKYILYIYIEYMILHGSMYIYIFMCVCIYTYIYIYTPP